jgi:hypothetical protein
MRKSIFALALLLGLTGTMFAGWNYAHPANVAARTVDTLICITTTPDTTAPFYFGALSGRGTVWMRVLAKNATLTTLKMPLIQYKLVGGDGKYYSPDSANGWTKLCDSCHLTISAADTNFQVKGWSSYYGVPGIVLKGTSTAESTKVLIRVTGE